MIYHINREYDKNNWNCAHCVEDYFYQRKGVKIIKEHGFEWDAQFLMWMRHYFKPTKTPKVESLIVCTAKGNKSSLHVGVLIDNNMVYHNSNTQFTGHGLTMINTMFMFETLFENIRYYEWRL